MKHLLLLILFFTGISGCDIASSPGQNEVTCSCEGSSRPVDPALLSFLSKARAAHRQADALEGQKDRAGALAALNTLVSGPIPSKRSEIDEVLADTRARMAELQSTLGQWDAAEKEIERGLQHAPDTSYFRGHLFEVRAVVEEQRAASLTADPTAAAAARVRAIEAAEQAIKIQDQVLRKTLEKEAP